MVRSDEGRTVNSDGFVGWPESWSACFKEGLKRRSDRRFELFPLEFVQSSASVEISLASSARV
jgi:hypothetical protein